MKNNLKKSNLTEMIFILDRSGSMSGLEDDTVGGFNSLIEKQKNEEGQAFVSTILFDTEIQVLHDREKIKEIEPITRNEYYVGGCTALLDAVGETVKHVRNIHKYARKEDIPEKTVVVITTDGMENSSCKYTYAQVSKLIKKQQDKYGWEFIFLGANIDSAATADQMGIRKENAANYTYDGSGVKCCYDSVSNVMSAVRGNEDAAIAIPMCLSAVKADYETRGRK